MTHEVGVITGDLTVATRLLPDGRATIAVQYTDADEWYPSPAAPSRCRRRAAWRPCTSREDQVSLASMASVSRCCGACLSGGGRQDVHGRPYRRGGSGDTG